MKGIILAGGSGTRLYPTTLVVSKQLLPVYDKPMIYYALGVLMMSGIREVLVISTPQDQPMFEKLLGNGERWGISLQYAVQVSADGIAQAFIIGEAFIGLDACALVLGDNLFFGHDLEQRLQKAAGKQRGATVLAYPVKDPGRYGVVSFDAEGEVDGIEEKPRQPRSRYAVTGLYFYDSRVVEIAKGIVPSSRGELEITDVNLRYLEMGELEVIKLGRGDAWLDAGTHESLLDAGRFVHTLEKRQGLKMCCPEEIAWRQGWIDDAQLEDLAKPLVTSGYGEHLLGLLRDRLF